jgi:hypothetical protein
VKSLLIWGIGSEFSRHAARALAADGHRLLIVGREKAILEQLDTTLVQSELHRLTTVPTPDGLAAWVTEQNIGLDGVVLLPPPPEATTNVLVPLSINVRSAENSCLGVVEVIRDLLPQLRRGKRPKRVLVVLDWYVDTELSPLAEILAETWAAASPQLTRELNKEGIHFNTLLLRARTESPSKPHGSETPIRRVSEPFEPGTPDGEHGLPDDEPCAPTEFVQSGLTLIKLCFSPEMHFLNGQFLQHPPPSGKHRSGTAFEP